MSVYLLKKCRLCAEIDMFETHHCYSATQFAIGDTDVISVQHIVQALPIVNNNYSIVVLCILCSGVARCKFSNLLSRNLSGDNHFRQNSV